MGNDKKYPSGNLIVLGVDPTGAAISSIDTHPEVVSGNLWGLDILKIQDPPTTEKLTHAENWLD